MGKRTTRTKRTTKKKSSPAQRNRSKAPWIVLSLCVVVVLALPAYRWWARGEERNTLQHGLRVLEEEGCVGCHRPGGDLWRWGLDGSDPVSVEMARMAVVNGRRSPDVEGLKMPAYGSRLKAADWRAAVVAVGGISRLIGVPSDPEAAAGFDVATELRCFGCHGLLGAGGVQNPGSLLGVVPGWYGRGFERATALDGGLKGFLRTGSTPARIPVPGTPGPVLVMPAWGERLDSIELEVLVRYVNWLHEEPPEL